MLDHRRHLNTDWCHFFSVKYKTRAHEHIFGINSKIFIWGFASSFLMWFKCACNFYLKCFLNNFLIKWLISFIFFPTEKPSQTPHCFFFQTSRSVFLIKIFLDLKIYTLATAHYTPRESLKCLSPSLKNRLSSPPSCCRLFDKDSSLSLGSWWGRPPRSPALNPPNHYALREQEGIVLNWRLRSAPSTPNCHISGSSKNWGVRENKVKTGRKKEVEGEEWKTEAPEDETLFGS